VPIFKRRFLRSQTKSKSRYVKSTSIFLGKSRLGKGHLWGKDVLGKNRLGKNRLGKNRLGKGRLGNSHFPHFGEKSFWGKDVEPNTCIVNFWGRVLTYVHWYWVVLNLAHLHLHKNKNLPLSLCILCLLASKAHVHT
jgi:hypothetical protein